MVKSLWTTDDHTPRFSSSSADPITAPLLEGFPVHPKDVQWDRVQGSVQAFFHATREKPFLNVSRSCSGERKL